MPSIKASSGERLLLGIDVGWAKSRRTCGVAIIGDPKALRGRVVPYASGLAVTKLTLVETEQLLKSWVRDFPEDLESAIVVLDGPMSSKGRPAALRRIDEACTKNGFHNRAVAAHVHTSSGRTFVESTYRLVESLGFGAISAISHSPVPGPGLWIGETNPTIGMALCLPQQDLASLPSRRSARLLSDGRSVRCKSDWYWMLGAGRTVGNILSCQGVDSESDHEHRAALYCLSVAVQVSRSLPSAVALGDDAGVYVVPSEIDGSWERDVQAIRHMGEARFANGAVSKGKKTPTTKVAKVKSEMVEVQLPKGTPPADTSDDSKGDDVELYIADAAGAWERHNNWLRSLPTPVTCRALDEPRETITLTRLENDQGHWMAVPTTPTMADARSHRGILSKKNPRVIPVKLAGHGPDPE